VLRLVDSSGASRVREGGATFDSGPERLPPVTGSDWLDARFGGADRLEQARGLQRGLWRLAACQAQLDCAIGAGLEALHARFDLRELGHSNFEALRTGRLGFSAPASVVKLWRQACAAVRAEAGTVLSDADVVRRMLQHLLEVHVTEEVLTQARRHRAIERDGWTCQMPHCRSNGPFHEHHRRFRSAGGSDQVSNLVTLCAPCHAMLHAGHVTVLGEAPDGLSFLLGTRREAYAGESRRAGAAARIA